MELRDLLADEELASELIRAFADDTRRTRGEGDPAAVIRAIQGGEEPPLEDRTRAIILERCRPALLVQSGVIAAPDTEYWARRIDRSRPQLSAALPSVGRLDIEGNPEMPWVGTGWIVAPDVVVTNRHVAVEFAHGKEGAFVFGSGPDGKDASVNLDFCHEHETPREKVHSIFEILHIEDEGGQYPDMAFLRVGSECRDGTPLPAPLELSKSDGKDGELVGTIGYADRDPGRNPGDAMVRIFGGIYGVKRLHPGKVMGVSERHMTHDCSTLGGNSGSAVIAFATGHAIGLHFGGNFKSRNFAVKASTVRERLGELGLVP